MDLKASKEIEMVQDLIKGWFSDNKVKVTSPVAGSFMGAWVIFNWKHFLLLFWGKGDLETKLGTFEKVVTWSNCNMWFWPLLVALLYAFGLPYLNVVSHKILKYAEKWRHDEVVDIDIIKAQKKTQLNEEIYKSDPANPYLGNKLDSELKKMNAAAEKSQAEADKANSEAKETAARAEITESEAKEKIIEFADAKRKNEREQRSHELAQAKHKQEVASRQFPTLFILLNELSQSLYEDNIYLPLELLSEVIGASFGYDDFNTMLANDNFTISSLDQISCLVYDEKKLFSRLKELSQQYHSSIDESELLDYLLLMFDALNRFPFIPSSSMEDFVQDYLSETDNVFDLVEEDEISSRIAESHSHSFGVESAELIEVSRGLNDNSFIIKAKAHIEGEQDLDKPYPDSEIIANFQMIYKPILGKYGLSEPEVIVTEAVLPSYHE